MHRFIHSAPISMAFFTMFAIFSPALAAELDDDKFRQLEEILPTPNEQRLASGAPGPEYWQQRADYDIAVELDDVNQRITGQESITYTNNSRDPLPYLWMQLDQNIFQHDSTGMLSRNAPGFEEFSYRAFDHYLTRETFEGGYDIAAVQDDDGKPLPHTIVDTMMRIDLPKPLRPGKSIEFSVQWAYNINNAKVIWGRTGYEYFEKDDNYLYEIAQWYPRMVAYTDVNGWHHKQFVGRGEFTIEFGDYRVAITVPSDHIVAATGTLQNPRKVLTKKQRERLERAEQADKPVYIVTPKEAEAAEANKSTKKKTWVFEADNVRDFAFAASRKFVWDAQGHPQASGTVMAMSFYPKEAEPLWSQYSTQAVIHTLEVYGRHTFDYPYPVAISVNGPIGGMEYPMICFNGPRPEDDGTYWDMPKDGNYWRHSKYGLISVIIHEVGHNWFPMIINSDERQWTWMDEGLNTFLQSVAEREWEDDYPSHQRKIPRLIDYMTSDYSVPIMTNSESLLRFGANAYAKPALALTILRETVMGRELFDFAFKHYSNLWRFKRPMPSDFFRVMEDASGIDLDWFWRGWFYSTEHTDIGITAVKLFTHDTRNPDIDKPAAKAKRAEKPNWISLERSKSVQKRVERYPYLKDFYNTYDADLPTDDERKEYKELLEKLEPREKELLEVKRNLYVVEFENEGGLIMPVIVNVRYTDGTEELLRLPAEIWKRNTKEVSRLIFTNKELASLELDPHWETADVNPDNNAWPRKVIRETFQLYKTPDGKSPMKKVRDKEKEAAEEAKKEKDENSEPQKEKSEENT